MSLQIAPSTALVKTCAFRGIKSLIIDVQVSILDGLPAFVICGLPDKAISESKERIKSALSCAGIALPAKRILVNLSPANIPKEGSHYDLPIALAILKAMGYLKTEELDDCLVLGELGLSGNLTATNNTLIAATEAKQLSMSLICAAAVGSEAALIKNLNVIAVETLLELLQTLNGDRAAIHPKPIAYSKSSHINNIKNDNEEIDSCDFKYIQGNDNIKRVLTIAISGHYNVLLVGSPGAGKSTICSALRSIQPPMTLKESLEVSKIYSAAGLLTGGFINERPFRNPHHTASKVAMIGGGRNCRPGEISLAHNGILFLDELTLWPSDVLNALREAMQTRETVISRAEYNAKYPANFQLIAATNPCPCGKAYNTNVSCSKLPNCVKNYLAKIPGPILDRIHMIVRMDPINPWELNSAQNGSPGSSNVLNSIILANAFKASLAKEVEYEKETNDFLNRFAAVKQLSMRQYLHAKEIAKTIAILEHSELVMPVHIKEALSNIGVGLT